LHAQEVRLATGLAVFDVTLVAACGLIHGRHIPLAAACALETSFHQRIISGMAGSGNAGSEISAWKLPSTEIGRSLALFYSYK
jgi:hypothetical protein